MLDDEKVVSQRDPRGALEVALEQWRQVTFEAEITSPEHDERGVDRVVVAGMGGSALAAILAKVWLQGEIKVPFEIVRDYNLPAYVGPNTLVIASSYSGNTEETLSTLKQAIDSGAQVTVVASGGKLIEQAETGGMCYVRLPGGIQPRMAAIYNLRAVVRLLVHFGIVSAERFDEIAKTAKWLEQEASQWVQEVSTDKNYAKQLALLAAGKTAVFYGGALTAPVAYKWKISWNENAKNLAFWNEYPEFNHNEFIGWTSHPVEKPFAVFDLKSSFEHPQTQKRFEVSDKLLSGRRPKSIEVDLAGSSPIEQLLWGSILADFVSIYLAIINGVDPTPVDLIEKLKEELA